MFESVGKKLGNRNVLMGFRKMYTQGREEAIKRVGAVVASGEKAAGANNTTKGRRQK